MFIVLIILMLTIASRARVAEMGTFFNDYISKERSTAVKGVFVLLVFLSHYSQYVTLDGVYDKPYLVLQQHLNQMIVALFLFYSGFGMAQAIKNKGFGYIKTIPTKRFLSVLINFDIAVILFLIINFIFGKTFDFKTILLSLIGWLNVGNSNWYIFVILVLYIYIYISFFAIKWGNNKYSRLLCTVILTLLTIGFVYSQMMLKRPGYTYNTAILLPLGFWYSLFKEKAEKIIMKNDYIYSAVCALCLGAYIYFYFIRFKSIYSYSLWAIAFTLDVVLFTMKLSLSNPFINWFGNHVFSIYILQRIPMMIFKNLNLFENHRYIFLVLSFVITVFLAGIFDYFTGKLSRLIWNRKKKNTLIDR